jgi:hypothetical protein
VTFVDWDELARWKMINTVLDLGLAEPEETYSSSEHLYKSLDIPAGSTGRIVKAKPVANSASKSSSKSDRKPDSKVESRTNKSSSQVTKDAPKARTERSRVRTKKFKES